LQYTQTSLAKFLGEGNQVRGRIRRAYHKDLGVKRLHGSGKIEASEEAIDVESKSCGW
jgi:hypothetical protein